MEQEDLIHDIIVNTVKKKLLRDFSDIKVNLSGERRYLFKDTYPDLIVSNHGMVILVVEVETERSITEDKALQWKELAESGTKLIVIVPKDMKVKVTDMLWKMGLVGKVGIGTYEINVNLP